MADDDLQALRRAARAGDPAARPALVRALLRAGRPVSEAWDSGGLLVGPGLAGALEVVTPDAHDAVAQDLGWLDPGRLAPHLQRHPGARRLLATYPGRDGERWLRVGRRRSGGPYTLDLERAPGAVAPGEDARLLRHLWDARCALLTIPLPFGVPPPRLRELTARLFERLGLVFQPRTVHRGVPNDHAPYTLETLFVDGPRRLCVREAWGAAPLVGAPDREHAIDVEGLPGQPPVALSFPATSDWCLRRGELVGVPSDLPPIERAWRDVLVAAALRTATLDDDDRESRLLPDAWRARARRATWAPHPVIEGSVERAGGGVWCIARLEASPFVLALEGDLAQNPDDLGVRVRPIGPAPTGAVHVEVRATREGESSDLLERLYPALTGRPLPADPDVSRVESTPASPRSPGDTALIRAEEQRYRDGEWVATRVREPVRGERLRVAHERGLLLVVARTTDLGRSLSLDLLVGPGEVDARRAAAVAALERSGWRL